MSFGHERHAPLLVAELIQAEWRVDRREHTLVRVHARLERRARSMRVAAVVSVVAVLGVVVGLVGHAEWVKHYALAPRDGNQVRFGDGSSVHLLDSASELEVGAASPNLVEVSLRSGRAEFDSNPEGNFIVHAGVADISGFGAHFRVTSEPPRVRVEVARGRVQVRFAGGAWQLMAGAANWFPPAE